MSEKDNNKNWADQLFNEQNTPKKSPSAEDLTPKKNIIKPTGSAFWIDQLFEGKAPIKNTSHNKLQVIKNGVVVYELDLNEAKAETILGRHPTADIQLEGAKISMFHIAILKENNEQYFIQDLGSDSGSFLNSKKLLAKEVTHLRDGYIVELPDFYLKCILPDIPALAEDLEIIKNLTDITLPSIEKPKSCPLMSHLIEDRDNVTIWSKGTTVLRVADIVDETYDTKTFRLISDEKPILFSYQPGQFITFLLTINGEQVQRSYSMSSSPSRPHTLELTVKRVPDGLVSNWLCDTVRVGDKLKVKGPSGKFTCFNYPSNKIMFLAAGSGITPIMSMARWIADTAADIDAKFIASFKTPSEIIFRKELELLSARHSSFRVALSVTASWHSSEFWTGFTGRINQKMIEIVAPDFRERHIFMCGPEGFMEEMKAMLISVDFPMVNLHSESFSGGRVASGVETHADSVGKYQVQFTKSGVTIKTNGNKSILDLAEAHGIELDYSCRAGYCGDCKAKVRGDVKMPANVEIEDSEKAEGFVYTCCGFPQGDIEVDA
ncbi:MAG: FAD-binding oxidoreductase [Methylococcales bacterium]